MPTRLDPETANAACDVMVDRVDVGGAGRIEVYTGGQPAKVADAATGVLLVTFTLANPAYGNAGQFSAGVAALLGVPISAVAVAGGTAGWFRVFNGAGAKVRDGSLGAQPSNQLTLSAASMVAGQTVTIQSGSFAQPLG
jgi:hypothetical protein